MQPFYWWIIRGRIAAPFIVGVLSYGYMVGSVYGVASLLDLKAKTTLFLLAGLMCGSLALICADATYVYLTDIYALALLLNVSAAWLCLRGRKRLTTYVCAAVLLMASAGLYQAYLQVFTALVMVWAAIRLLEGDGLRDTLMRLYPRCGGSIAALGMGMGLFFAVYHIVLAATGIAPEAGQNGMANLGDFEGVFVPKLLLNTWLYPIEHLFSMQGANPFWARTALIFALLYGVGATAYVMRRSGLDRGSRMAATLILLLLPAVTSLIYAEWAVMGVFLLTAAISAALGFALRTIKPRSKVFYMREGFAATALSWITISIMGAVPFVLTGCIPNPVDAMFETVSGFTTTGASILPGVEGLPNGILFWRSFTHWIGGMGVLVFLLSLLPLTGGSHVNLMKAESPGPQVDKLVPKVQSTAKILYGIYFALTVVEVCFLLAGGMNVFDSLLTAFGTAGTGGFGFKNDSFASFSPYIQWVVTIFMILFGVNFNAYFLLLLRRFRRAASSEEVRAYFAIILAAVAVITVNIRSLYGTFGEALRHAAFQVGSIITTTGFSSCDFDLWPTLAKEVLVLLMFVGACAGSTGGGIKVSRFLLLGKTLGKELKQALHPQVVAPVRMDGKLVNHETIRTTNVFLAAYIFIFAASFMLVSLDGFDMVTNFTSIAATLNNIGPGLNQVGPMMNFGAYSNFAKLVLIFDMLAGRLEIFPMLVLFLPDAWRRF